MDKLNDRRTTNVLRKVGMDISGGALILAIVAAGGCGGGGGGNSTGEPKQLSENALVPAGSQARFDEYLSVGMKNIATSRQAYERSLEADASLALGESAGFGFSSTNVAERWVDEADWVKQNESHIFTVNNQSPQYYALGADSETPASQFEIKVFAKPSTQPLASVPLDGGYAHGIYLKDDTIAAIATKQSVVWGFCGTGAIQNGKTQVDLISVATPESPVVPKHFEWDGSYVSSRRIGNSLYVVSQYGMDMSVIQTYENSGEESDKNPVPVAKEIDAKTLPVTATGQVIDRENCLIPQNIEEANINPSIVLITQLSLNNEFEPKVTCVAASAPTVYVGLGSLYLLGQDWVRNETAVHKFAFDGGHVNYRATGSVAGFVDWANPQFSVNEYQDVLRILTVDWESDIPKNRLFTLAESSNEAGGLELLAELPNAEHPEPIGKSGETIRGVRFVGGNAYIVTFLQTDPLYKLDLSNPADPKVAGRLELPGFSAYLQALNERYLLGVGYTADADTGRQTGLQFSVFDVSDAEPRLVSQESIAQPDGAWLEMPLAWDHHAMSHVSNGAKTRLLIPYSSYEMSESFDFESKLAEFEIDEQTGVLQKNGIQQFSDNPNTSIAWSVLDGDSVYSMFNGGGLVRTGWLSK